LTETFAGHELVRRCLTDAQSESEMGTIRQLTAGISLISCIWLFAGCAEVVVPGTIAGGGEYYRYTTANVPKKTFIGNVRQVTAATQSALKKMDIQYHSLNHVDSETEMTASTDELDITITMKPITSTTTKVSVNAVKDHVIKDKATAAEILFQINTELERSTSPDKDYPKVFVKNNCHQPIDIIVYYLAGRNQPETWQTRGWFNVGPGQKKHVADTHNRYIYFYGETRSVDKLTWSGNILQWFEGKRYPFFKIDMGTALMDFTQSFSCD